MFDFELHKSSKDGAPGFEHSVSYRVSHSNEGTPRAIGDTEVVPHVDASIHRRDTTCRSEETP